MIPHIIYIPLVIISFFIGQIYFKLKMSKKMNETNGKCGVIVGSRCSNTYFVEVEEIARADKLSKIRMIKLNMSNETWRSDL